MNNPLVSVIMPTYNHADYIKDSIESVLGQSYKNLELIIINNYSDDNTEDIINTFKDDSIKYLKFHNNGIIAVSRNIGIRHASGKYIAFIDSDDIWLDKKLEYQISFLENNKEFSMVYAPQAILGQDDLLYNNAYSYHKKSQKHNTAISILENNFISCSSVMIKKDVFEIVGYIDEDKELVGVEDCDLWVRIAMRYRIGFIDKVLSKYRIHDNAVSQRGRSAAQKLKEIKLIKKYDKLRLIKKHRAIVKYILLYIKAVKYALLNKEGFVKTTRKTLEILK